MIFTQKCSGKIEVPWYERTQSMCVCVWVSSVISRQWWSHLDLLWLWASSVHGICRQEYWSGWPFSLQVIFLVLKYNGASGLLHCSRIFHSLSHQFSNHVQIYQILSFRNSKFWELMNKYQYYIFPLYVML